MKILYVHESSHMNDIPVTLRRLGYEVEEYPDVNKRYSVLNDEVIDRLVSVIREHRITHLFSIHLVFNLVMAAEMTEIKYISYIWDAPYINMYTPFGRSECCYFSTFDRLDCERFREAGIKHVRYAPLAVNAWNVNKWSKDAVKKLKGSYINEVSFVGRLYENNAYDENVKEIPVNIQDYFTSIFAEAAFKWDGVNRIYGQTEKKILDYIHLVNPAFTVSNKLDISEVQYFESMYLIRKLANIERIAVLNTLSEIFQVSLYTTSDVDPALLGNVKVKSPIPPGIDTTIAFIGSKINLNISLKGIEGGTPKRVMDVMAAGGFMLTNYCPETADIFKEDEEIVMYKTPEELVEKAEYYLKHDDERKAVAKRGQEKVLECHTYEKALKKIMEWIERED